MFKFFSRFVFSNSDKYHTSMLQKPIRQHYYWMVVASYLFAIAFALVCAGGLYLCQPEQSYDVGMHPACFISIVLIFSLCIVLTLVHWCTQKFFIAPGLTLLSYFEYCTHSSRIYKHSASDLWRGSFELIQKTFYDQQQYLKNLSDKNKELDLLVCRRTDKLRETNAQLRSLIDSIPDAIFFKNIHGVYLGCNKTAERMLGTKERIVIGARAEEFLDAEDVKQINSHDHDVLENNESIRYQKKITVGSQTVYLDILKFPYHDHQGNLLGLICTWRDVTGEFEAAEQLRLSEERYHLAMDVVEDGLWDWYVDTNELVCNPAFFTMLDYDVNEFEVTNERIIELIHPEDRNIRKQELEHLFQHPEKDFRVEFRMQCKDDDYIWILARGRVVEFSEDHKPRRMIGTHKDITRHKENERALLLAKQEAESASLYKSQFLANMSHEIRTPMNAVLGMLQLLKQTKLNAKQSNYIEKAHNSSESLLTIISDILDFSKIEAGKLSLEREPFSLLKSMESAIDVTVLEAHQKGVSLIWKNELHRDVLLLGDSLRLSQVFINLLMNAVKFTDVGEVEFGVALIDETTDELQLKFWIRDTGIGMTLEQQRDLFDAFAQADGSTTRRFGGTGLGLSICQYLIQQMGSYIYLQSEKGKGSLFSFILTFSKSQDAYSHSLPSIVQGKVCILEPCKKLQSVCVEQLSALGYQVLTTIDENNLFDVMKEQSLEAVFIDFSEQTTLPLLKNIQSIKTLQDPPKIILMTDVVSELTLTKKAYDVPYKTIRKPFSIETLKDALLPQAKLLDANHQIKTTIDSRHEKILLVEDNPINQQVAYELLKHQGFDVEIAEHGLDAVKKIKKRPYDLVLMDVQMPEMDGLQATKAIRAHKDFEKLPIIAMTAHATQKDREQSLMAGMNDYVTKPFVLDDLTKKIRYWLDKPTN